MNHEYYVFPADCIDDLEDMIYADKNMFIDAILSYWTTGDCSEATSMASNVVKIALRHAIRAIDEIKKEIEE